MRPQDVLPDNIDEAKLNGVTIRKGTVAAFIANAVALENPTLSVDERDGLLRDIEEVVPALRALGLFDVFEIKNPQLRAFVGEPAIKPAVDLDTLYSPPSDMIKKAVLDRLVDFHEDYIKAATFFCLATGSERGLDASPRGGPPGFVHILDQHTVAFPDWPGNNKIESMRNLERDERIGMLFIFPGLEIFLRINGRARVSTAPELLATMSEEGRAPKTAIVVAIDEVIVHCGKAVNRAKLWAESSRIDRSTLPSVGKMMSAFAKMDNAQIEFGEEQVKQINDHYDHGVRNDLY